MDHGDYGRNRFDPGKIHELKNSAPNRGLCITPEIITVKFINGLKQEVDFQVFSVALIS